MREATKRSIFRWIHIVFGIPILGYIYDSPSNTPHYAPTIRYVFPSCSCSFGALDVEGTCRSTTDKLIQQNYSHENGTRIGGIKIQ
jgi:hypothetical protein